MSEVATRFRLPRVRLLIPIVLWAAYIAWMGIGLFGDVTMKNSATQFGVTRSYPAVLFALDFWGLVGGLIMGMMVANPLRWLNGKRLAVGGLGFGMMLGRLIGGGFARLLLDWLPLPSQVIFLITPFDLLFSGITLILVFFLVLTVLFGLFVGVPVSLFTQLLRFENAIHVYRYQARGLAGYMIRFVFWLRNERMPAGAPDDSKGARFATMPEIKKLHRPLPESMAFGHLGNPLFLRTDKHVLIMASTRSGKGVTLIMPHLLRYQGSAFVLDPKGENAKGTGRRRAALNTAVHYLDPFGITGKPQSRFNPLARFTPQNMEAESKALAAALFVVGERERDHWTASGQQLLAALILYVYVSPDFPEANKDLPTVRRCLLGSVQEALREMVKLDDADGLLRDLAMSFVSTPEREFGSIVSAAQRQTEILDNPYMIACLSATGASPEVDFKAWHTGTMTVYLCLSAPKFPTFNRWLRLVLTSALDEMTDKLNPPKLPVCFLLDELATLGHLTTIENAVGLSAGYGIQLVTVFQDVAQMRDLYKGRWASFIGNAGVRALFNLDDFETAEYWSKFVGSRIVETHSRQEDLYGLSQGQNVGETMRPLLPSDKLMMDFASGKMLVLAQGAHPIITDRVAYWDDPSLNGLWDDPRVLPPQAAQPPIPMPPPPPPKPGTPPPAPPPRPNGPISPPARPASTSVPAMKQPVSKPTAPTPVDTPRPQEAAPTLTMGWPEPPLRGAAQPPPLPTSPSANHPDAAADTRGGSARQQAAGKVTTTFDIRDLEARLRQKMARDPYQARNTSPSDDRER